MTENFRQPKAEDRHSLVEHLSYVYQLEYATLNVAAVVAGAGIPIIVGFLSRLPANLHDDVLLTLPLAPLMLLMVLAYLFTNGRTIGKYARTLERLIAPSSDELVSFPALSRLNGALYGGETRRLVPLRIFFVLTATTIAVVSIYSAASLLVQVRADGLRYVGYVVYSALLVFVVSAFAIGAKHSTWKEQQLAVLRRDRLNDNEFARTRSWPTFISEALLPRPASILKGADSVFVLSLVLLLGFRTRLTPTEVAVAIVAFDLVLYQTRYLLNGAREDSRIVALPANVRNDNTLPLAPLQALSIPFVAAARVFAFVYIVSNYAGMSRETAWAFVGAFLLAYLVYEMPREVWRRRLRRFVSGEWSPTQGRVPRAGSDVLEESIAARLRAMYETASRFLSRRSLSLTGCLLLGTSGLGYGLRAAFVLAIFAPLGHEQIPVAFALVISMWATGSAQASAGWVVEAQGAIASTRGGPAYLHPGLVAKPHLAWAATVREALPSALFREFDLNRSRVNRKVGDWSTRSGLVAPWDDAAVVAMVGMTAVFALAPGAPWWRALVGLGATYGFLMLRYLVAQTGSMESALPQAIRGNEWVLRNVNHFVTLCVAALGALMVLGSSGATALAAALGLAWPVFKVLGSQGGDLQGLMRAAEWFRSGIASLPRRIFRVAELLLELLFGHPVVHAFEGRFEGRRDDPV